MSSLSGLETRISGASEGLHLQPETVDDVAAILRSATDRGTPVTVWGGGTKQKLGRRPGPGIVMSMEALGELEAWEPDDLTMVVGAGATLGAIEAILGGRAQTAVLPETSPESTIGGVLATASSSLRRGRLLGVRERVLEVTVVTGDGRVVRSGGRVVKNVSGYDLHRASVGAFGSLGVIVSVCLKLWPVPPSSCTIEIEDPEAANAIHRPLAMLGTPEGFRLYVWGTEQEISDAVDRTGGSHVLGLQWPDDPDGRYRWSLRVPAAEMGTATDLLGELNYIAVLGGGEIRLATDDLERAPDIREWATSVGGALVLIDHPEDVPPLDPWGFEPQAADIQRRLIAEFDPARIINPGRMPGGL